MSIHLLLIWAYFNVITALEFIVPKGLILLFLTTYVGNEIDQRLKDFQSQPYSEVAVEKSDESTNYIDQGRDKMLLTVLGLGILGIAWMLIDSEVKTVKKSARVVEFTIDSISIKTGNLSNTKFIGETSDYLFTYDTVSKSSSIYNKSEIKSIKVFK